MSEEEKNAFEYFKRFIEYDKRLLKKLYESECDYCEESDRIEQRICRFEELLKLIERLEKNEKKEQEINIQEIEEIARDGTFINNGISHQSIINIQCKLDKKIKGEK